MMNLDQIQRTMLGVIQQPLAPGERMRRTTLDGRSVKQIVDGVIKPNDRLTSFERLEIYNRVYWFRILSSLADDFEGLRAVIGQRNFDKLLVAYLTECPSKSFTLRDLGSRLPAWLEKHPELAPKRHRLALDMARLEWADIEVYDAAEEPVMSAADLAGLGEDPTFRLQPYLQLFEFAYPVDEFLLKVRDRNEEARDMVSNVATESAPRQATKKVTLPKAKATYLAVHRNDLIVYFKDLDREGYALLRSLQQGKTLSQAISDSVNWGGKSVQHVSSQLEVWFRNWSNLGWFCKPQVAQAASDISARGPVARKSVAKRSRTAVNKAKRKTRR